jgi:hypothetical protein
MRNRGSVLLIGSSGRGGRNAEMSARSFTFNTNNNNNNNNNNNAPGGDASRSRARTASGARAASGGIKAANLGGKARTSTATSGALGPGKNASRLLLPDHMVENL